MLEGLEVKETYFLDISKKTLRLEPEFYTINTFEAKNYYLGEEIIDVANYNSIYGMNTEGKGYPAIRMNEFDGIFTDKPQQHAHNFSLDDFHKHKLRKGDILICRTNGNPNLVGKSALVNKDFEYVYESHLFKVRPIKEKISSATLTVFLNCKFGKAEIKRYSMQGNQANFSLAKFREIKIPCFSENLNHAIDKLVLSAFDSLEVSKQTYTQAENLLLTEIGLQDFKPSNEAVNIKSFSDSLGRSGRLDAEYYQPKYEQVVKAITAQKHDKLDKIVDITKSIEPGSANYYITGLPFLRVADYSKFGLTEPQKYLKDSFVIENKDKINQLKPKKGTILFSKDGSVGTAYHLREDFEGITSGAILHLSVKNQEEIIPEYLTLVLNSQMVQMQAERDAGGSIILHWRVSEIENVVVPIIDYSKQQQIAGLIEQSFFLKQQSEHLLEVAKHVVEIAIEEDESVAMAYIKAEVTDCEISYED